ncbi:helix-turn-helix domain-containing protein [Neisseria sp. ZJ106]|uniref:Helix-turn-helix transcriptional regulator n=1 Tax=Neisseria lisongii TaxID=2912188 RepID=A0ABY7RKM9_9NEIS|nr:helix-turn-helix transcriptional regulator [Neisseria lisongii]MCF7521586.1 helix-turn-helix domain-containing protein [Neisseria lisongii]WCL71812.1 helix-turn-helix transcriptional regulator [Neisseria lisongii]
MNIGTAIHYLRKQRGWTQQQLADFANTSKSNISNLENGNQGYSPAILQYLAKAFGCSVSQIFLLAEQLEKHEDIQKNWQNMPIDSLFIQLPSEIQNTLHQLIISLIQTHNKNY